MRLIYSLVATMAGLAAAAWLFSGIWFDGVGDPFTAELQDKIVPLAIVALIVWAVDLVVAPVVKTLSLPIVLLTLGLFLLVVNALLLVLVAWIAGEVGIGFHVEGFWTAVGGALVITLVERVVSGVLGADD